jgi:hypothetical protein
MPTKILVLTYCLESSEITTVANKNKIDYCNYWNNKNKNYSFFPWIGYYAGVKNYIGFYKIKLFKYLFDTTNYNAIFFQETNTLIMNFLTPLEKFMDSEHSIFISESRGNFIIKNNAYGRQFIDFADQEMAKWTGTSHQTQEQMLFGETDKWKSHIKEFPASFNKFLQYINNPELLQHYQKEIVYKRKTFI